VAVNTDRIVIRNREFVKLISKERLSLEIERLGKEITGDYAEKAPLFVVVLNGAFMFAADLIRELRMNARVTFIRVSSYTSMQSSGNVKQVLGLTENIEGKDIVLIEDIIDSGLTAKIVIQELQERGAASVRIATLLRKRIAEHNTLPISYVGFDIEDRFVVGYGLDFNEKGRNLKHIYVLDEST